MRARFAGMFLNEGESENKRRVGGIVIGHQTPCRGEKQENKMKRMDENEMKERKNNIKCKKS